MTWDQTGEDALRAENVDAAIKGLVEKKWVFKNLVSTPASSSWLETYYVESSANLTAVSGISRGASFPIAAPIWQKNTAYMKKVGLATEILHEDIITNNIDVISRSLAKVADAVVASVDSTINTGLLAAAGNTVSANAAWDNATRANRLPHEDIAKAIDACVQDHYLPDAVVMHPSQYAYFVSNDYVLDSFDASGPNVMQSGNVGRIMGLDVVVSENATDNTVMVLKRQTCGTYRIAEALRTITEDFPGIKKIIKAWEIGTFFVTDPNSICTITSC